MIQFQIHLLPQGGWIIQVNARFYPGYYESREAAEAAAAVAYDVLDEVWQVRRRCTCCGAGSRGAAMSLEEVESLVGLQSR